MRFRKPPDDLTPRERQVLDFIRLGLTNEEIAARLGITLDGAKYHVSQILSKLGVATREEAAAVTPASGRRWWAALPLAAKLAGAALVVASTAGIALLAWGVIRTGGPSDGTEPTPASAAPRVVPWSELPAPAVAQPFTIPGVGPCQAADLVMTVTGGPYIGSGPKDTSSWNISVANTGWARCFVGSTLDVRFITDHGALLMSGGAQRTSGDIVYLEPSTVTPPPSLFATGQIDTFPCAVPPITQMELSPGPGLGKVTVDPGPAGGWGTPCPDTAWSYLAELFPQGTRGGFATSTQTAIDAPPATRGGEHLRFLVTIRNEPVAHSEIISGNPTPPAPLVFSPCPTYHEELEGVPGTFHTYQLNCAQAATIEPNGSETFEMFIDVPPFAQAGPAVLVWSIDGSPAMYQTVRTNIWIEPPLFPPF